MSTATSKNITKTYTLARHSLDRLISFCEKEEYQGYDPYDGLNSRFFQKLPLLPGRRLPRLAWIQLFKRFPVNLRPLVGISKEYNPKGVALFLAGYCKLAQLYKKPEQIRQVHDFAGKLIGMTSPGFSGSCWGYNFPWESRAFYQPRFTPTIVASTFAANALLDAYELTGHREYLDHAVSTKDFVLKDLKRSGTPESFVFSYSPFDNTSVFNASLLGAKLLARIYSHTGEEELVRAAAGAVNYCCQHQNKDGSWFYSTLPFHQWIDNFHTGFNLECILDYSKYSGDNQFSDHVSKGMNYYLHTFFDKKGRSAYYNNSLYPIDIHAPAQLFVTLYKAGNFEENRELADSVLKWTVENMQSPDGHFYYQKRRFYTNRIPYMRWSQAWIFYGLAHYLMIAEPTIRESI